MGGGGQGWGSREPPDPPWIRHCFLEIDGFYLSTKKVGDIGIFRG